VQAAWLLHQEKAGQAQLAWAQATERQEGEGGEAQGSPYRYGKALEAELPHHILNTALAPS
jgi:hypothetical protein